MVVFGERHLGLVVGLLTLLFDLGNGNSMRRDNSSNGKQRHSRGSGMSFGIRTYIDSKEPRFQSASKIFKVPESESVVLPYYTENLGDHKIVWRRATTCCQRVLCC